MKNLFNGMFGMIEPGLCRMSMSGKVAVKTSGGYKTYDVDKERLTNCDGFVFDIGEEFFFVVPTNHARVGDILLVNGKPKCVREVKNKTISVIDYEDSSIKEILPERHIFMGNTYFYGVIRSMFGDMRNPKGSKSLMKTMMMASMMSSVFGNKGDGKSGNPFGAMMGGENNSMAQAMAMSMFFGGGMGDMLDGVFDFGDAFDMDGEDDEDYSDEVPAPRKKAPTKKKPTKKLPVTEGDEENVEN